MSKTDRRVWRALGLIFVVSFTILLWQGREIYRHAPPIPEKVVDDAGNTLFTADDIRQGQLVWRTIGGHETGSIWGHGSYVAPDWNADWLHREVTDLLDDESLSAHGQQYQALSAPEQAAIKEIIKKEVRTNTYNPDTGTIVLGKQRAGVVRALSGYYQRLFGDDPSFHTLREQYAIRETPITNPEHRRLLTAFLFWTTWATETNRPSADYTYTSNWPHEPLIDNRPTGTLLIWSVFSILLLIAGIAALAWHHAVTIRNEALPVPPPDSDPLALSSPTPSMLATRKYFWTAVALFLLQIGMGATTAHYAVEGHEFYGVNISDIIPYAITRTWHTQLGLFWIATIWLGTGLYFAPMLSGHEPKLQKTGVNVLYVALVLVVLGSMAGEWFGVQQYFDLDLNFWFGHQGYEFVDLGKFWQMALFAGLIIWLLLVTRDIFPVLTRDRDDKQILWVFFLSSVAIGLFYGAGLFMGKHTHLAVAEYWRWWVVHLWVEAFFEVFATAVIAVLFVRLGLIRSKTGSSAVIFSTAIFLTGGIIGTLHHLYFGGVPTSVIAWGASLSALEVVPLCLIGFEAYNSYHLCKAAPWVEGYRWPILFFVSTAFWNLVGAGIFGFLINPPISLYYIQGLNTTPLHAHTALFGVYGTLGIGFLLTCMKGLSNQRNWDNRFLKWTFWSLNGGLAAMALTTLLPVGVLQGITSINEGYWHARSPEFIHQPLIHTLVWLRMIGDVIFAVGALTLAMFLAKLAGWYPGLKKDVEHGSDRNTDKAQ